MLSAEQSIRLECLKLAHTHGREPAHVLERAGEYERFVTGNTLKLAKKDAAPTPGKK